jgi:YggT family protein
MMFALKILDILFTVFNFMILIRILSSWVPELSKYKIIQFVSFYVDPYLNLFRKIIPPLGMIDISPIVAIIALNVIESGIFMLLN